MPSRFATSIATIITLIVLVLGDDPCKYMDNASHVIDLSSLSSKNSSARYSDVSPSGAANWKYSFNPCEPFSEGAKCIQAAVCQVSLDGGLQFILGKQDQAQWDAGVVTNTNPILKYSHLDESGLKNVEIELICNEDPNGALVALGEVDTGFYKFQLLSKCSCWDGCKADQKRRDM